MNCHKPVKLLAMVALIGKQKWNSEVVGDISSCSKCMNVDVVCRICLSFYPSFVTMSRLNEYHWNMQTCHVNAWIWMNETQLCHLQQICVSCLGLFYVSKWKNSHPFCQRRENKLCYDYYLYNSGHISCWVLLHLTGWAQCIHNVASTAKGPITIGGTGSHWYWHTYLYRTNVRSKFGKL